MSNLVSYNGVVEADIEGMITGAFLASFVP